MKSLILLCCALTIAAVSSTTFESKLFSTIAQAKTTENIIFSPVSIKTCLAMAYLGAEGYTADEMKTALELNGNTKDAAVAPFSRFVTKNANNAVQLRMANRVYVDTKYKIATKYNDLAQKYFESTAEKVKFSDAKAAAKKINSWVESQTEHKIQNLLSPDSLQGPSAAILVNAIYFKANWSNYFDGFATDEHDFHVSETHKVRVNMMFQEDKFLYGDLQDLNALAIEMPFRGSDIAMLVLLPKTVNGLADLEARLQNKDVTSLSNGMTREKVQVYLPKFRIEYDISLKPALQALNMPTMFTPQADFSGMLSTKANLSISEVKHKAFIEVNEMGTEAAAATYAKIVPLSLVYNERIYDFKADHPFYFAIKDKENVYFAGHVANL